MSTEARPKRMRAVLYAAKSTEDEKGSIPTQLEDCRKLAEERGAQIETEFSDEAKSAFKGNRGAGLEKAKALCEQIADEGDQPVLVVQHSDRLARGDGKQAMHLVEYQLWAFKLDVTILSVQDQQTFGDLLYAVVTGQRNAEDSSRKSMAVRDGKKRQMAKGEVLGGPVCDGYKVDKQRDDSDRVIDRTFLKDSEREEVLNALWDLAKSGRSDSAIARELNRRGYTTRLRKIASGENKGQVRGGKPFDRRAVQDTVTNAFYAGFVVYNRNKPDELRIESDHEGYVTPEEFDAIQDARTKRDRNQAGHDRVGRPVKNHALAKLAICGHCGARLYAVTSPYRRKDGTKARSYVCHNRKFATGVCDAKPINAEVVDAAVIDGMDTLLIDFETWRKQLVDGHQAERARLAAEVDRAQADLDAQGRKTKKVEAKWSDYVSEDDARADLVLPMVERERESLARCERRLTAAQDALDSVPTDVPADAMLDFANSLREAVRGRLDGVTSMQTVNEALRENFAAFVLTEDNTPGLFGGITIQPLAHPFGEYMGLAQSGSDAQALASAVMLMRFDPPREWLRPVAPEEQDVAWDWPKLVNTKPDADPAPPLRWLKTPSPTADNQPSSDRSKTRPNPRSSAG